MWVIKAGQHDDDGPPEYLHKWRIDTYVKTVDVEWVHDQRLAFRFTDRNHVSEMCNTHPICAYSDDVRIVKLRPRSTQAPKDDEQEKKGQRA